MRSREIREGAITAYLAGEPTVTIAGRFGIHPGMVGRWVKLAGHSLRYPKAGQRRESDVRSEFIRRYEEGEGFSALAESLNVARSTLIRWRHQLGLKTQGETRTSDLEVMRGVFEHLYATTPLGLRALAKKCEVGLKVCRGWMRAMHLPQKSASASVKHAGSKTPRELWSGWWREVEGEQNALAAIDALWGKPRRKTYHEDLAASRAYGAAAARRRHARLKHTPEYKIRAAARNAIARIARMVGCRRKPKTRTHQFLGCDYAFARAYLTTRLQPGMTWENHGTVWEVDHVIPISRFDLTNERERKKALHFSNLQPLFKQANREKSAKVARQSLLAI